MQAMLGEININKWLIYEWSIYKSMKFQQKFLPVRLVDPCDLSQVGIRTWFEETFTKHWPPRFSLNFCSLQVFNLAKIGMIKLIKLMHIYPSNCLFRSFNLACLTSMWMMQWLWYHGHHFTPIISCDLVFRCFTSGSGQAESTSSCVGNSSFALYVAIILVGIWVGRVGVEF